MPQEYQMKEMSNAHAKIILEDLVAILSDIEPEDLTTFELNLLKNCVKNPPKQVRGCETKILDN